MTTSRLSKLQNNAYVVATHAGDVLVNSPPEILNFLLVNGFSIPKTILPSPDVPIGKHVGSSGVVKQEINHASVEFILNMNYFFNGGSCII